jgi:hypothetical protein
MAYEPVRALALCVNVEVVSEVACAAVCVVCAVVCMVCDVGVHPHAGVDIVRCRVVRHEWRAVRLIASVLCCAVLCCDRRAVAACLRTTSARCVAS